jgi:YD repeat-containing protein
MSDFSAWEVLQRVGLRGILSFSFVFVSTLLFGQYDLKREIIPPPPNAASLGKYGDTPVGLYTGIPQISIPLYEIKNGVYSLPVALSYHAGGIKVDEIASNTGVSWSLMAGGMITRTIRGLPDESGYAKESPNDGDKIYALDQMSEVEKNAFFYNITHGGADNEPDVYFFNFAGRSGKIIFDRHKQPVIVPFQKMKITGNISDGFEIITEDGVRYSFQVPETTETFTSPATDIDESHTSSWYLSYIEYPDGKSISFGYSQNLIKYPAHRVQSRYDLTNMVPRCETPLLPTLTTRSETQAMRITAISSDNELISFQYIRERGDLEGDKSLDSIIVENHRGELIRKFALTYGNDWGRLRLDKVQEIGAQEAIPPYRFLYGGNTPPPPPMSYAQDHWGFYNGAITNTSLVPRVEGITLGYTPDGADRESSAASLTGILKKIIYPTGGYTTFDYQTNDYGYVGQSPTPDRPEIEGTSATVVADPPDYNITPLTIDHKQDVVVRYGYTRRSSDDTGSAFEAIVTLFDKTTNKMIFQDLVFTDGESQKLSLEEGQYELGIEASGANRCTAYMEYRQKTGVVFHNMPTGGARIGTITDYGVDGKYHRKKRFVYTMPDDTTRSSGVINSLPVYHYNYAREGETAMGPGETPERFVCAYIVRKSGSVALGTTQGSHVGYRYVTVYEDDNGAGGKQTSAFTSFVEHQDVFLGGYGFPFAAGTSVDHRRGFLKEQVTYRKTPAGYDTLQKIQNFQKVDTRNRNTVAGITVGIEYMTNHGTPRDYTVARSQYLSEWVYPTKTIERRYAQGNVQKDVTEYYYEDGDHAQMTSSKKSTSAGDVFLQYYRYPLDYPSAVFQGPAATALKHMRDNHIVNRQIERSQWKRSSGMGASDSTLLSADLTTFKVLGPNAVVPDSICVLTTNLSTPVLKASSVNSQGYFTHDRRYRYRSLMLKYDNQKNVRETLGANGIRSAYIWGYGGTLPIAEAINTTVDQIFHTSFEDSSGDSPQYKTGMRSHAGVFAFTPPAQAGAYRLTYWTKAPLDQEWVYHDEPLSLNANTASMNIGTAGMLLDEVRVYPPQAMMKTLTFKQGVGIRSVTDQSGKSTRYVYDGLGRLVQILDDQGHPVQTYSYHYKKPQ